MVGTIHFLPAGYDPDKTLPLIADGQLSLAAAQGSTAKIVDTTLQSSYLGVILGIGTTVRSQPEYDYTGSIVFQLLINGSPFLDNNQGTWTTQRGSILNLMPTLIHLPLSARITFIATRAVAAVQAQTIAFCATGIMYPRGSAKPQDHAKYRI